MSFLFTCLNLSIRWVFFNVQNLDGTHHGSTGNLRESDGGYQAISQQEGEVL